MNDIVINECPPHADPHELEQRAVEKAWPELVPLERPSPPGFPAAALPGVLRDWVEAESETTQTPPDMAALLGLSVFAAALAKRVKVSPWAGWVEPVNLYVATVLDPANRKSAVFRDVTAPLREVENQLAEELQGEIAQEQSERRRAEKALAKAEKTAAESPDAEKRDRAATEAGELAEKLADWEVRALPTMLVDDITTEQLAVLLSQNSERIALMSAEGGVFGLMNGKYSKSGGTDFELYLNGHCGDFTRVDRVCRPAVVLKSPALTMGLAIQPEVIRGLSQQPAFRGRGLLGRFLYAVPKSWIGSRVIRPKPMPVAVSKAYGTAVQDLAELRVDAEGNPHRLVLSDASATLFEEWCTWIEKNLGDGLLEDMRDWGGKLAGATLRIAGIMHCIRHGQDDAIQREIEPKTVEGAIHVGEWAIPHAAAAFDLLSGQGGGGAQDDAQCLLRWIKNQDPVPERFDRRDAQRHGQRRFNGAPERLDEALKLLEDSHHIARDGGTKVGGKVTYLVSPRLRAAFGGGDAQDSGAALGFTAGKRLSPLSTLSGSQEGERRSVLV